LPFRLFHDINFFKPQAGLYLLIGGESFLIFHDGFDTRESRPSITREKSSLVPLQ